MTTQETTFDPTVALWDPRHADAPQSMYHEIRKNAPVARATGYDGVPTVYVSRYQEVMWALRHPEVFSSAPESISIGQEFPLIPLQVDPPNHAKYRRWLDPEFSPKRIAELDAGSRELANSLIDAFIDRGECNYHEELATPLPSAIFLALMGLPQSDLPQFLQWRDDTIRPNVAPDDIDGAQAIREAAGHAITEYFASALDEQRDHPGDGLLARIAAAEIEGEAVPREEQLGVCHLMLIAGLDTVTATLDCEMMYLARHPEERRRLVADPSLTAGAVEELMRWESPVQMVVRVIKQDHELAGVSVRAGDHAVIMIGAANLDDEFSDADRVEFDREANRHLAFGAGPHRCLGSHLARLEQRVALEEWHRRIPDYRIADGAEVHCSPGIRQAEQLPLVWS